MSSNMNEADYWTLSAMEKFGGSFVKALAHAAHMADPINLQKIKTTWASYWDSYVIIGARMQAENDKSIEHLMDAR